MNSMIDCFTLNNGVQIPCVGFGTWQSPEGEVAQNAVATALRAGYRHIDTAAAYGNEQSVGRAIHESGIPREQVFVTTKLWNENHGYEATHAAIEKSLNNLGLDYVDLYLIHWPNPISFRSDFEKYNAETWKAMEEIYASGKARAIGVSNYRPHHLDALLKIAKVTPAVNQIRLFPGFDMAETVDYCRSRDILLEAYSPFGTGKLLGAEELKPLAEKYGKSSAQICVRWSLQRGFLPLPKSVTESRIIENANVFDFVLTDEEMEMLNAMPNHCGEGNDPDICKF